LLDSFGVKVCGKEKIKGWFNIKTMRGKTEIVFI
jgi:hypothetical protein